MIYRCMSDHKEECEALKKSKSPAAKAASIQPDLRSLLKPKSVKIFGEAKQHELNKAVVFNCVVHDKRPLCRFDSAGFRKSFELVSDGKNAVALDCWSRKQRKFMAMTGHFIQRPEWKYCTALLGCSSSELNIGTASTGELVNTKVDAILDDMGITCSSISAGTSDSDADLVKGIQLMKKRRVPCGAHGGQKVLSNALMKLIHDTRMVNFFLHI
jgi:hypothetical protein